MATMTMNSSETTLQAKIVHDWLQQVRVAFVPGPMNDVLEQTVDGVLASLRRMGHEVVPTPDNETDAIITTARFGEPASWRRALMFSARKQYDLSRSPKVFTYVTISESDFQQYLKLFDGFIKEDHPDPEGYQFAGLAHDAYQVLHEQGRRGGPILALQRLIQGQAKSIRVVLVVGDERPQEAYHFDLVGAFPRSQRADLQSFYDDIVLRMVTTISTSEVTNHKVQEDVISRDVWNGLTTPTAMLKAARELGKRSFFTKMVRIADLVSVPAVGDAIASQYSEGCFATYDPELQALIATVTGSARPVDKDEISENDLAVIVGVTPNGDGAIVRHVEDLRNDPPSSEAVEMMDMDSNLPRIYLSNGQKAPVIRSKLHGHRGVAYYDPKFVEYVPLDPPYYDYPVSCATLAQAQGIKDAFARSLALQNPDDPRQLIFTVLPGHGLVMGEKWVEGKAPFQVILEHMDASYIQVESRVPQGRMTYLPTAGGMALYDAETEEWVFAD